MTTQGAIQGPLAESCWPNERSDAVSNYIRTIIVLILYAKLHDRVSIFSNYFARKLVHTYIVTCGGTNRIVVHTEVEESPFCLFQLGISRNGTMQRGTAPYRPYWIHDAVIPRTTIDTWAQACNQAIQCRHVLTALLAASMQGTVVQQFVNAVKSGFESRQTRYVWLLWDTVCTVRQC